MSTFKQMMEFVVLDKITCELPTTLVPSNNNNLPSGLDLADPEYFQPNKIDMLIGGKWFGELLKKGIIKTGYKQLTLHETAFGWVVAG